MVDDEHQAKLMVTRQGCLFRIPSSLGTKVLIDVPTKKFATIYSKSGFLPLFAVNATCRQVVFIGYPFLSSPRAIDKTDQQTAYRSKDFGMAFTELIIAPRYPLKVYKSDQLSHRFYSYHSSQPGSVAH